MSVYWYGETENYEHLIELRKLDECNIVLACNDYAAMQITETDQNRRRQFLSIPLYAAKACTSRLAQRVALAGTGLNPRWHPLILESNLQVIKQAGSTVNSGVRFFPENNSLSCNEQMQGLIDFLPELSNYGVAEYKLEGIHYEIDGCIIQDQIMFFTPIRQYWDEKTNKIASYSAYKGTAEDLYKYSKLALRAIGLNNSCFCIEFIHQKLSSSLDHWFVIEVNARLGDDKGLAEVMCKSGNPIKEVEEFAKEILGK